VHDLLGTRFLDAASHSRTSRIEDEDDDEYEDEKPRPYERAIFSLIHQWNYFWELTSGR